jgi:PadR family transcriptional regulator, regulatory protein PadR
MCHNEYEPKRGPERGHGPERGSEPWRRPERGLERWHGPDRAYAYGYGRGPEHGPRGGPDRGTEHGGGPGDEHGRSGARRGGRMGGFVQPMLLLQLAKQPAHGYELMEAVAQEDGPALDPGAMYRMLRFFEEQGLVRSQWETGESGPARRVYEVTDEGLEYLQTWAATVRRQRAQLDRFLADYESFLKTRQ